MPPAAAPFRVICGTSPNTDMLVVSSKNDKCEELREGEIKRDKKRGERERERKCVCVCERERKREIDAGVLYME